MYHLLIQKYRTVYQLLQKGIVQASKTNVRFSYDPLTISPPTSHLPPSLIRQLRLVLLLLRRPRLLPPLHLLQAVSVA